MMNGKHEGKQYILGGTFHVEVLGREVKTYMLYLAVRHYAIHLDLYCGKTYRP